VAFAADVSRPANRASDVPRLTQRQIDESHPNTDWARRPGIRGALLHEVSLVEPKTVASSDKGRRLRPSSKVSVEKQACRDLVLACFATLPLIIRATEEDE
jgi:hypothetical protein